MTSVFTNQAVGPYVLREIISAGGVAEVFRAHHRETSQSYAVKVIRPERQSDKYHLRCFREENDLLSELDHPGIPKSRRYDSVKGRPCIVMDYVEGRPLHLLVQERASFHAQNAFLDLVEITAYLHSKQIVHNDLKLENVILGPNGKISLVDFGNARRQQKKGLIARMFARKEPIFGTPTYLAPELIAGEGEPSYRSDLYSLGVCCFILLTGEPPFVFDRKSARLRAAVNQAAPSLASRKTGLSPVFVKLVDACLSKDPSMRPEDAQRLHHACRQARQANTAREGISSIDLGPIRAAKASVEGNRNAALENKSTQP
jgi:eukaryotic-like serine/threonine-protein kinase